MIKRLIFIGISLFLINCKKTTNEKVIKETVISKDTIHKTFNKSVFLNDLASKEMNNWKHFEEFQNAITNFYQTTPDKAKLNAKDLSNIIVKIKDSITIEKLNKPDVIARLNILNNEALRLHDMSTISTITNEEVNAKIENIIYAYESIIAKINQVYILNANEESVDVRFSAPKVLNDSVINTKKPSETEHNKLKIIKQR